MWLGGYD
jgi:fatty-acyl-CoA synthase